MSHKKDRQVWQHKFNLYSDNPDDVRLHEHLVTLAKAEEAMKWIRNGLTSLLALKYHSVTTVEPQQRYRLENLEDAPDDTHYAPLEDIA